MKSIFPSTSYRNYTICWLNHRGNAGEISKEKSTQRSILRIFHQNEACYPLQAVCQDYHKPSEVCAHHRYYSLQQKERKKKKSTVSYASSICDFTSSTEEVTHFCIETALSTDHSNLILLEPGTVLFLKISTAVRG